MRLGFRFYMMLLATVGFSVLTACSSTVLASDSNRQVTLDAIVSSTYLSLTQTQVNLTPAPPGETVSAPTSAPTLLPTVVSAPTIAPTATPDSRLDPKYWSEWPIVPTLSPRSLEIYNQGIEKGNNPKIYSTIGDCQSEPNVFMGIYATDRYYLGEDYFYLEETIDYYREAFQLKSQGVRDGLSAPSALSSTWADPLVCNKGENPVECELRLHKPSIVFINLGTNWKPGASANKYEEYLRKIVEIVIQHGSLPVLSTKADNVEGDHSLNRATARVAHDYDIPLWNFWRAAQSLPNNGLDGDRDSIYLAPEGWDRRNFTALQVLDAVRRSVQGLPLPSRQ